MPIHVSVPNTDMRGHDYSEMPKAYRPSHANATYYLRYGVRSVQGGGRSSARETIGRIASGAVAKKILKLFSGTEILAYVSQVHKVVLPEGMVDYDTLIFDQIESKIIRCPDPEYVEKMIVEIDAVRVRGDFVGGVVTCIVRNCPRTFCGSPVFDKLEAQLAKAAMSLPATKGFEFGSGFAGTFRTGSEHNDVFHVISQNCHCYISFYEFLLLENSSQSLEKRKTEIIARGRHDPCVVPRAVPMVEAMVALVLVDQVMA
ncbi:Chorismate synthase [Melia azedarach]|uniref:Chorismate synthase n=1 Tax=Melia azedarach TaxID=155640 RepID=A0ACC1WVT7_MELAZ|nr:Chorismate synthase [Melia azedarach]